MQCKALVFKKDHVLENLEHDIVLHYRTTAHYKERLVGWQELKEGLKFVWN